MQGSLYLTPQNVQDTCDLGVAHRVLDTLGVSGGVIVDNLGYRVLWAGPNFSRHIVYAGCSPHLRFEPTDAEDMAFCHVALHGPFEECVVQVGENTVKPRCPQCRSRFVDWADALDSGVMFCCSCRVEFAACELDWRQQAAAGRVLLEIRNVFPSEASPGDMLLGQLYEATQFVWTYAWANTWMRNPLNDWVGRGKLKQRVDKLL